MSLLAIDHVSVNFGGLKAVSEVSLSVAEGAIQAIIGPNGAGKTTLFNVITGFVQPTAGEVRLERRAISHLPPHLIARRGISRSFQTPELFGEMTLLENVLIGSYRHQAEGLFAQALRLPRTRALERAAVEHAQAELAATGLLELADTPAGLLPLGKQRLLEISRAMASQPRVLLLDEPASGLNTAEVQELRAVVERIRERKVTVVLIEHNVGFVMELAERVAVLDHGQLLAEGTPEEVRHDAAVISAYLGAAR